MNFISTYLFIMNLNKVNLRYQNSLINDPDLRLNIKLTNFLFLIVNLTKSMQIIWTVSN